MLKPLLVFVVLVPLFLTACSEDGPPAPPAVTATPAAGNGGPAHTPGATGMQTGLPSRVRLERVFPSLSFDNMTGMYPLPGGGWLVTEQAGRVHRINAAGAQASVFLDIDSKVNSGGEEGLLGLALAPDFATSGVFYVHYSAANPRRSVFARYTASGGTASASSEQILLEVQDPYSNHNGGQLAFGPDGFLYIGLGDGGSRLDPQGNGQNLDTLFGKILRIDVSGGGTYRVPADNPFVGRQGARGEVWAYGLRNPWRFSFDSETGDLWAGDVGQNTLEEIDVITKGGNYGWVVMEGNQCTGGGDSCDRSGKIPPVVDYPTGGGNCAVTGGFVYQGSAIEALRGAYVYGDYCSGRIWALRWDGTRMTENAQLASTGFGVSSFAQGPDGEIYVLQYGDNGGVFRLAP
jgi:glucose/arabinose dehydrogenase